MNPNYHNNPNVHTTGYVSPPTYTTSTTGGQYGQPGTQTTNPVVTTTTTKQTHYIPPTIQTVNTGNQLYTNGVAQKWHNPYNLSVPLIKYDPTCRKCHGTGVSTSRFSGTAVPCTRCYTRHGYCKKCYGNGINFRKNKPCTKCDKGKKLKKTLSSSSSQDSN